MLHINPELLTTRERRQTRKDGRNREDGKGNPRTRNPGQYCRSQEESLHQDFQVRVEASLQYGRRRDDRPFAFELCGSHSEGCRRNN